MLYAVPVDDLNAILFLSQAPPKGYEEYHGEPEKDVRLEEPEDVDLWRDGVEAPDVILARSRSDRHHFKVFRYREDFERERSLYEDTARNYACPPRRQFIELMKGIIRYRHNGQWIAWSKNGTKLVAAAKTFQQVDDEVNRSGMGPAVFELVEPMTPQTVEARR